ncbi:BRO family protein [Chondrinema litorale]|uniref:BRO family protein n=1 Tax=Chondrinema litorale TaxID=2994555 RepID=UPI002542F6F2|nr:BRO family protein [Chondrinema litorale]UZS00057.1 BRO family protein [Chondrinema litorale]
MNEIIIFESKEIRSVMYNGDWYFVIADVVEILVETNRPVKYWSDLKKKIKSEGADLSETFKKLPFVVSGGRKYQLDCANTEGLLRIIQSIPSIKAEPFKQWLAKVGSKVLDEKTNKRLAAKHKLEEVQDRLFDNIKDRGVDKDGFKRINDAGDKALFGGKNMKKKYDIDKDDNLDDHMNTLLLMGKGLATEMTNHHTSYNDLEGEDDITNTHEGNNEEIRTALMNKNIKPEEIPPEEDLKKLKGKNKKNIDK